MFFRVAKFLGDDTPEDFTVHLNQAIHSRSDTRAMGYLLLAALTLFPEGWAWSVSHITADHPLSPAGPGFSAQVWRNHDGKTFWQKHGTSNACAACVVGLKARAAMTEVDVADIAAATDALAEAEEKGMVPLSTLKEMT